VSIFNGHESLKPASLRVGDIICLHDPESRTYLRLTGFEEASDEHRLKLLHDTDPKKVRTDGALAATSSSPWLPASIYQPHHHYHLHHNLSGADQLP
jgi:hypothetical protein